MEKNYFDAYAKDYNVILKDQLHYFDEDTDYFARYKVLKARSLLTTSPQAILDFGCGVGRSTHFLKQVFPLALVSGCDTSESSLVEARRRVPETPFLLPEEVLTSGNQFDFIFVACVLHHIAPCERESLFAKLIKLSKSGCIIMIFEHNPLNPITRRLVKDCPFDRDAVLLRPREIKDLFIKMNIQALHCQYTLFFPQLLKFLRPLEYYLQYLPLGGQYVISGLVK